MARAAEAVMTAEPAAAAAAAAAEIRKSRREWLDMGGLTGGIEVGTFEASRNRRRDNCGVFSRRNTQDVCPAGVLLQGRYKPGDPVSVESQWLGATRFWLVA